MTLCVAWIRQVDDTEELVFATDSMLSGGETWEHGIKLFELPRKDCLLCFCGNTGRAYPLILNLISSINLSDDLKSATTNIVEMLEHITELFTSLAKEIKKEIRSQNIHELRGEAKFLFGGWDWQKSNFRVWDLFYLEETEGFVFKELTDDRSKTRFYKFIGDATIEVEKEAKDRLKLMLYEEDKQDEKLDMEPLKILKDIALDPNISKVGGSLQIAKVYKSSRTEFFGIVWQSSKGSPYFQGRQYNYFNKPLVRYINSDTFEIMNMDLPQSISNLDMNIFGEDSTIIQECYPSGILSFNIPESKKDRLKAVFKEAIYVDFLVRQDKIHKKQEISEEIDIIQEDLEI